MVPRLQAEIVPILPPVHEHLIMTRGGTQDVDCLAFLFITLHDVVFYQSMSPFFCIVHDLFLPILM